MAWAGNSAFHGLINADDGDDGETLTGAELAAALGMTLDDAGGRVEVLCAGAKKVPEISDAFFRHATPLRPFNPDDRTSPLPGPRGCIGHNRWALTTWGVYWTEAGARKAMANMGAHLSDAGWVCDGHAGPQ